MWSFAISGTAFLLYACYRFNKTKIFYPSIIFSTMWGLACIVTALILNGSFGYLYLSNSYSFHYLDEYILYFTGASLIAFIFAHMFSPQKGIELTFSLDFLERILQNYRWLMWLNFFGGLLRIILMISIVGVSSVMDYRLAANDMMNSGYGPIGLVFRLTNYIQLLANFYIALCGLMSGFNRLNLKKIILLFILYSPTQMATGGRLFILYFILFYVGSFLLGRGLAYKMEKRPFLENEERRIGVIVFAGLFSLVSLIAMFRETDNIERGLGNKRESPIAKFTYISEGMLESEYYMRFYPPDKIKTDDGVHLITGKSDYYLRFRGYLQYTYMSSIIVCIITPLYTSFGYWGSIIAWFIIALILETISITILRKMSLIRFFIYLTILKVMYEAILTNSIAGNFAVYELIILLAIFYKRIFGKLCIDLK